MPFNLLQFRKRDDNDFVSATPTLNIQQPQQPEQPRPAGFGNEGFAGFVSGLADTFGYSKEDQQSTVNEFTKGNYAGGIGRLLSGSIASQPSNNVLGSVVDLKNTVQGKGYDPFRGGREVSDFQKSFAQGLGEAPGQIVQGTGMITNFVNNELARPLQEAGQRFRGLSEDQIKQRTERADAVTDTVSKDIYNWGKSNLTDPVANAEFLKPKDPTSTLSKLGSGASSLVTSAAASTVNPGLGIGLLGLQSAGSFGQEAYEQTGDFRKASTAASINAPIEGALEYVGGKLVTSPLKGLGITGASNIVGRGLINAASEGTEEGAQQLAQNIVAKNVFDPNRDVMQGVVESAGYGAALGSLGGAVSGGYYAGANQRQNQQQPAQTQQTPTVDQLTQQAAPGTVQANKQFSQNVLDNAAQQYRAGQIDEAQLRRVVVDNYQQQFNKQPQPADIAGYMDPIMGITNRAYVQNVGRPIVGQPAPYIEQTQQVNESFNQPRDSAGRYGRNEVNPVELNALKEYQRGLIQQLQTTPQNTPTYRGIQQNYNDAQAQIDAMERNLPAPKPIGKTYADNAPVSGASAGKFTLPDSLVKQGYKLTVEGELLDPQGNIVQEGIAQQILQNPELTKAEQRIKTGEETYDQAEAETTALKEAKKYRTAQEFIDAKLSKNTSILDPRRQELRELWNQANPRVQKGTKVESPGTPEKFVSDKPIKIPDTLYRATKEGGKTTGTASYGQGLYTASSRKDASQYGKNISRLSGEAKPSNPLQFKTVMDFRQWENEMAKKLGISRREMYKNGLDVSDYVKALGHDGVTIGPSSEMYIVKYDNKPSQLIDQATKSKPLYETVPKGTFDEQNTLDPKEVQRYAQSFGVSEQEAIKALQEIANPEIAQGKATPKAPKQRTAQIASGTTQATLEGQQASPLVDTATDESLKSLEAKNFTDSAAKRLGYKTATKTPKKFLITRALETATGGRVHNLMQLSVANRTANKLGDALNRAATQSTTGGDSVTSKTIRAIRQVYSQFGLDPYLRTVEATSNGNKRNASWLAGKAKEQIDQLRQQANPTVEQTDRHLNQFFAEQDWLDKFYGKDTKKLTYEELNPIEQQIADKMIQFNKERNASLYAVGQLDTPGYEFGKDGMHTPRIYGFTSEQIDNAPKGGLDTNAVKHRKDAADISQDVFDQQIESPTDRMLMRWEVAMHNQAVNDMMKTFDENGLLLDKQPNKSFTQLTGRQYGEYEGKWADPTIRSHIDGELIFTSKGGQAVNNLIQAYKGTLLGKADRFQKKVKTVFSPGTVIGNIFSNPVAFQPGSGVSTIRQIPGMAKAAVKLARFGSGEWDADIYQANQMGVFTSNTAKSLVGDPGVDNVNESLERRKGNGVQSEFQRNKSQNIAKKGYRWATAAYGGVDNAARYSAYKILQQKGMTAREAATEVGKFAQDYDNVGKLIQTISDMPLLGKPFARFAPELVRITKNNVVRAPVKTAARLALLAMIINMASSASGETPEEREARETGVGQTLLPGTAWLNKLVGGPDRDISLNIPMGNVAVNIARVSGLNFPLEPGKDASTALLEQLLPVEIPTRKNAQGQEVFDPTKLVTSLTLRPFMEQLFNLNFIGRSITDPQQRTYYESGDYKVNKWAGEPSMVEQIGNRFRALAVSLAPFGNEVDSLYAGVTGQGTLSGKQRTLDQAIWRVFGVKTQDNSPEARQTAVELNQYFSGKVNDTNQFLNANPDLARAYYEYNNPTKDRETGKKVSNLVSPEKWNILRSDTSGRLLGFVRDQAIKDNQRDGKPIDPIFNLAGDPDKLRQALEIRSRPTGDDMETEERLRATQPWYNQFEAAERQYYKDNQAFFEQMKAKGVDLDSSQNDRVKAYNAIPYPEQSDVIKQYYAIKAQNPEAGKQFYKAYAGLLSDQFAQYKQQRLDYVNAKRAIEGFPPISPTEWNNVTFGYEADEAKVAKELYYKQLSGSGYGRGYGRRSGGGVNQPFLSVDSPNVGRLKVPGGPKMLSVSPGRKVAVVKNPWKKVGNRSRA